MKDIALNVRARVFCTAGDCSCERYCSECKCDSFLHDWGLCVKDTALNVNVIVFCTAGGCS